MSRSVEVRYIEEADTREWLAGVNRGFLRSAPVTDDEVVVVPRLLGIDPARTIGAFDDGRCVGTFRTIPRDLTVPGGATLPASGVTSVTVTATHRRRGLLSRMMATDLAACRDRGEPVAILIAAEYPIYGRFGFGPATWITEWTVDLKRAQLAPYTPPEHGRVDLVTGAELRAAGPELHERVRRLIPGAINRPEHWWRSLTGDLRNPSRPFEEPFYALYRDDSGRVDGMLVYTIDNDRHWDGKLSRNTLAVRKAEFATTEAERALWRYAMSVDWITTLVSGFRPPDDVLPLLLGDPRAAQVSAYADLMWLRVLDVEPTLRARGYATEGSLVLGLRDPAGHADGIFRLDAATEPGASVVKSSTEEPELVMDIGELGALYLGDESAVRLAALGRVTELTPGAAARADLLLRTPRRPWCPDIF
jgi:predicted acetyltransferase